MVLFIDPFLFNVLGLCASKQLFKSDYDLVNNLENNVQLITPITAELILNVYFMGYLIFMMRYSPSNTPQ
jgi:hypothetical protein